MPSRFKSLFLLFFIVNQLAASEVVLTVLAPGYSNKKISVWVEDDLFTGHRSLIDTRIITNDKAVFKVNVREISLVRITLDYQYGLILTEPGNNYTVVFPVPKDRSELSLAGKSRVQLIFNDLNDKDINYKLSVFNAQIDGFIYDNFSNELVNSDSTLAVDTLLENSPNDGFAINRYSERKMLMKVDEFRNRIDSIYSNADTYFTAYRKFVFADLEYSLGEKRRKVYDKFLEKANVDYNNVEFVKFFKTFYGDFFDFYSYYPHSEKLIAALESAHQITSLLELIKGDTLTGSEEMQWLILQNGLYDLYPNTSRWKNVIIGLLEDLKDENPYPEQRLIAAHMIEKLVKGKRGTRVPEMKYLNANGDTMNLSDLNGKMVYIQFFASWNTSAIAEMELISDLRKRYGNLVEFVSISIDEDFSDFALFVSNNKEFKWEFGWIGEDAALWKDFEIAHLPLFYLIDEQGKIISWPALWPSTGIESIFHKTKYNKKNKKKKGYWDSPPNKSNNDG